MKNGKLFEYINGRKCTVLGLGVSNASLAEQLCDWGLEVSVIDKRSPSELGERAINLEKRGVRFSAPDSSFSGIDGELIFRSPGIRPDKDGISQAILRGAELTSEMELTLKLAPAMTFGITGSDGKTTTTTLTGKFLEADSKQRVYVGGNIGTPLLCECGDMTSQDCAVLELSSFQLMTVTDAPMYSAITNLSPNHLDWHMDMGEYLEAKKHIVGKGTRRLVTNADCQPTLEFARECSDVERVLFSSTRTAAEVMSLCPDCNATLTLEDGYIVLTRGEQSRKVLDTQNIQIPGRHNVENFMTAIGLTLGRVEPSAWTRVARGFLGVEHRLELVRELGGIKYYNSSIDSSPTRTAAALSAMADKSLVIICGGYDKNLDYAPLGEAICRHGGIRAVVLTGATAPKIGRAVEEYSSEHPPLVYEKEFSLAVSRARELARSGDCVVLTPASASFDAFKNFAERGSTFKRIVVEFK